MSVNEEDRHELHSWLAEQAGPKIAATLMSHLPPTGWIDVTTNTELDRQLRSLETLMTGRMDQLETSMTARMDQLEARIDHSEAMTVARFDQFEAMTVARFDQFEATTSARFDQVMKEIDAKTEAARLAAKGEMEERLSEVVRTIVLSVAALMVTMTSLLLGAIHWMG